MYANLTSIATLFLVAVAVALVPTVQAEEPSHAAPRAFIDGVGPDWKTLGPDDFADVNGDPDTWTWKDGLLTCKGTPIGVHRSAKQYTNFEFVAQWRHLRSGGNSGFFAWVPEEALKGLEPGKLPRYGVEVQALDHGYVQLYEERMKAAGKTTDQPRFFTTHGDVFAVGNSKMKPFEPTSPNGGRSFPRKELSKGVGEWNHYYVRAINGELRLWVNGEEVSGGTEIEPRSGYLCLESEGSPIEFRNLRIRELP